MKSHYISLYLLIYFGFFDLAYAGSDPASLQQQAVERIEKYTDHFRKTGDYTSQVGELLQAHKELTDSYNAFIRSGANASAALSLIKLGDVQRMQNKWQEAGKYYQQGYDLAKRADHIEYQARALLGQSKTEKSALEEAQNKGSLSQSRFEAPQVDYSQALKHAQEAVQLTQKLGDNKLLFDALDAEAAVEIKSGELDAAMSTLNLAFPAAQASSDKKRLLYAYLNRADLNYNRVHNCAQIKYQGNYEPCYDAAKQAKSDYEQVITLARQLEYAGLEKYAEGFLGDLEAQRFLVITQKCLRETLHNVQNNLPYTNPDECVKQSSQAK